MTVHEMWNQAKKNNSLPPEWATWAEFRAWVNTNRYKAEYGYKGEFTSECLLKAIPGQETNKADQNDKIEYNLNSLMRKNLIELKELASNLGIETSETSTKREISTLIMERGD